ncbi:zinc ribbon domain-containing protein [Papillibacter cinnamivorans]|nr:zinc ribbon domain-containing protein [Papillibacter cinnamivorans]
MDEKVRELMDKVRETAISMGEAAEYTFRNAGKRAEEMLGITKLNMEIFDLNTEINILLKEIGQIVYDTHTGKETDSQLLDKKLAGIDEKRVQIKTCREQIAALKKSRNCPVCGEACEKDDKFCRRCGQVLGEEYPAGDEK